MYFFHESHSCLSKSLCIYIYICHELTFFSLQSYIKLIIMCFKYVSFYSEDSCHSGEKNIWLLTTKFPGQNTVRRGRIHSSVEGMNASNFIHKFIQELKAFISKNNSPYNNRGAWWWTHKELKRKKKQQKICQNHSLKYHEDCCLFM